MKFLGREGRKGSIVGKMYSYVESSPSTYQDWTCYVSSDCIQAEREGAWGLGGRGWWWSKYCREKKRKVAEEFGVYVRMETHNCCFQPSIMSFGFFERLDIKRYLTNSSQRQHCDMTETLPAASQVTSDLKPLYNLNSKIRQDQTCKRPSILQHPQATKLLHFLASNETEEVQEVQLILSCHMSSFVGFMSWLLDKYGLTIPLQREIIFLGLLLSQYSRPQQTQIAPTPPVSVMREIF